MRRPSWPQLTRPVPKTDEFGLPLRSHIGQVFFEPADEREQRLRLVRRFAFRAYRAVCRHLGEEQARKLFAGYILPSPREERPRGPHDPRRAGELALVNMAGSQRKRRRRLRGRSQAKEWRSHASGGLRTPQRLTRNICGDFCIDKSARQPYSWFAVIVSCRRMMGDDQEPADPVGTGVGREEQKAATLMSSSGRRLFGGSSHPQRQRLRAKQDGR